MRTKTVLVISALGLATLATVVAGAYIRSAHVEVRANSEPRTVLVATAKVEAGIRASEIGSAVTTRSVPGEFLPEGALSELDDVKGMVLTVPLVPGQIVSASLFVAEDDAELSLVLPDGAVAIALPVDEIVAAGRRIRAGDKVSIIGTVKKDGMNDSTKLFLHGVPVLSTSWNEREDDIARRPESSKEFVIVSLSPVDAERVVYCQEAGHVWLGLESSGGISGQTPGVTNATVF